MIVGEGKYNGHYRLPSVKTLLFIVNTLASVIGIVVLVYLCILELKGVVFMQCLEDMRYSASTIKGIVEATPREGISHLARTMASDSASHLRVTIVDSDGTVLADTNSTQVLENHSTRPEIATALAGSEGYGIRESSTTGKTLLYYAIPIHIEESRAALRLSIPIKTSIYRTTTFKLHIAIVGAVVLVCVTIFTLVVARFIVSGLKGLEEEAKAYKAGDLGYKDTRLVPQEMMVLRECFEDMARTIQKSDMVRKDFVANVSHELRTPITSIVGFSETLLDGALDDKEEARHFIDVIYTQSKRLGNIIEDLLTLSRLELEGAPPLCLKEDIVSLTRSICEGFMPRYKAANMSLTAIYEGSSPIYCMLNAALYEETIGNILDNALKYCAGVSGGAIVTCNIETIDPIGEDGYGVKVSIEDNGPGIPTGDLDRVFERFYRVDKGRSRDMGGTGLGLSIARHIVRAFRGSIYATPRADGTSGTCFIIVLPRVI